MKSVYIVLNDAPPESGWSSTPIKAFRDRRSAEAFIARRKRRNAYENQYLSIFRVPLSTPRRGTARA